MNPLLTIAIPTYNRSQFLDINLRSINEQILDTYESEIEIIVSDNSANNESESIVKKYNNLNLNIKYIHNKSNIGSDCNVAQCFNLAKGKYVHIFCDDDIYSPGALTKILNILRYNDYGMVYARPYGFVNNPDKEFPLIKFGRNKELNNIDFIEKIATHLTLASCCNKSAINEIDANQFCGSNLVQLHLYIQSIMKKDKSYYFSDYMISYKKNNSGGYDLIKVFAKNFGDILDLYVNKKIITLEIKKNIEFRIILCFFPIYIKRLLENKESNMTKAYQVLREQYSSYVIFKICLTPMFSKNRFFSLLWSYIMTVLGRLYNGDLALGITYLKRTIGKKIK